MANLYIIEIERDGGPDEGVSVSESRNNAEAVGVLSRANLDPHFVRGTVKLRGEVIAELERNQ